MILWLIVTCLDVLTHGDVLLVWVWVDIQSTAYTLRLLDK